MQYNCNEILLLTVDPKNEKQTKKKQQQPTKQKSNEYYNILMYQLVSI